MQGRNFMTHKFTILFLTAAFLAGSGLALTAGHATAQGVNYNTSKSNAGNGYGTAPKTGSTGEPSMAVKHSGIPQNTTIKRETDSTTPNTKTFDPGHGMATGRRQHQP
jgi:hypothetical protein